MKKFLLAILLILSINLDSNAYYLNDSLAFKVAEKGYSSTKEMFEDQYKKFVVLQKIVQTDLYINSTRDLKLFPDIDELKKICKSLALLSSIIETEYYEYKKYNEATDNFIYNSGDAPRLEIFFNKYGAVILGYHHRADINPYRLNKVKEILVKQKYGLKKDKIEDYFFNFNEKQIKDLLLYFDEKRVWKGVLDNLPEEFLKYKEKFFIEDEKIYEVSFCIWKKYSDKKWNIGSVDFPDTKNKGIDTQNTYPYVFDTMDGSGELLWNISKKPERLMETLIESYELWDKFEEGNILDYDAVKKLFRIKDSTINAKLIKKINPNINLSTLKQQISATSLTIIEDNEK